ncbi:phosphoglucomutase-2 isoform X3 [Schistocerca piceifrons]|nr:phosphoglucomutase-2 isoform X3 [Schistocerca piceifrons]
MQKVDSKLQEKIDEWLEWDKNEGTTQEIKSLCASGNYEKLSDILLNRLEFGTAGLRGRMGAGYAQMNDLVIIQTTQGFTSYLEEVTKQSPAAMNSVVIGYDSRHNSKRFAQLAANILIRRNVQVYLFSQICPTPFVPFAILHFKCAAGIMVTASHNPKDDNGYKVYWSNGAQIISPHDKNIQKHILNNLCPWENSWDTSILQSSPLMKDPLREVWDAYYSRIQDDILFANLNANTSVKFTYTPLHGVGYPYMLQAFNTANFKPFIVVEEQKEPDPEFPTVKFPNPEEGKSALNLSFTTAEAHGSIIIIANDPDADRVAVAEKSSSGLIFRGDAWHVFTGNELGALLGWWSLFCFRKRFPETDMKDVYMMASTVSSKFLRSMANVEGYNFVETLTGFKWMGNKADQLIAEGKHVIFAFEEAIGFMFGTAVLDKDGISAGIRVAEMVAYLQSNQLTLADKLNDLYTKYGHHISKNSYFICHKPEIMKKIFERLRNFQDAPGTYPGSLLQGKYQVIGVRDLTTGYDSSQPDKKALLPTSKSSQMLTFTFKNGLVATLRTSGTEPKLKYYTELCASPTEQNIEVLKDTLEDMIKGIIEEFLQPEVNGLIPRQ